MRRAIAAVVLAGLVLSACSGRAPTVPSPPEGVAVGGEVTISMPRPASVDPGNILDRSGEVVARAMCDPLLEIDRTTGEYVSSILDSWVITDGGTRLVLRIRRGLTFADGSPVTARDVVFGMSRSASADFAGENAWMLAGIAGSEVLLGLQEAKEPRHRVEFAGIRLMSDLAFEVTLNHAAQNVLPALTSTVASPLSREAATRDPEGFAANPVCIGPYRATEPFDPMSPTFTLERVPEYQGINGAFTGGGQGYLDRIVFHWTEPQPLASTTSLEVAAPTSPAVALPAFDEFDIVELDPGQRRSAGRSSGVVVVSSSSPSVQYVGLPAGRFPAEARRALSQALDRTRIAEVTLQGQAEPATGFLPRQLGSRLFVEDACGDATPRRADLAAARATLKEAGLSLSGVSVPLVTNPDLDNTALVTEIARQWNHAFPGLTVTVVEEPWDTYRRHFQQPEGFSTAFRMSDHVPFASPDLWLRPFWSGSIGHSNAVAYSVSEFDEIVDFDTAEASDPVDQAVLHREAQDILCRDLPLIPVVTDLRHFAVSNGLASATGDLADLADPVTGGLRLRELYRP